MNKKLVTVNLKNDAGVEQELKIYVVKPNNNAVKEAEKYRAKTWNQCISDGIITKRELSKVMKDRGIWDDSKTKEYEDLINKLNSLERDLYVGKTGGKTTRSIDEGVKMAQEMKKLRDKLQTLIGEKQQLEQVTAEALSENAKFDYFVSECTFYENDERVYKSIDDYNEKASDEVAYAAATAMAGLLYSFDEDSVKNLPENKWLAKFNLVDDDLNLVNKEGKLVDWGGKLINKDGYYVTEDGQRVDKDGLPLNEDGTYVIQVQYEDQDESSKTATKVKKKSDS